MKLFEVTDGYMGKSDVRLLVIADTQKRALNIARYVYEKQDRYWERLEATELCGDTSIEWNNSEIDG